MFLEELTQQQLTLSLRYALFNIDHAVSEYVETAAVLKFRQEGEGVSRATTTRFGLAKGPH
jgi:hypothetical protein